jgi:hypothetical protein
MGINPADLEPILQSAASEIDMLPLDNAISESCEEALICIIAKLYPRLSALQLIPAKNVSEKSAMTCASQLLRAAMKDRTLNDKLDALELMERGLAGMHERLNRTGVDPFMHLVKPFMAMLRQKVTEDRARRFRRFSTRNPTE